MSALPPLRRRQDGGYALLTVLREMSIVDLVASLASGDDDPRLVAVITDQLERKGFLVAPLPCAEIIPFGGRQHPVEAPCDVDPSPETAA